nr:enoyl-CoA hydratase-related protein [Endozoicomonas montiporae]
MDLSAFETLLVHKNDKVWSVTLNRPAVANAMNLKMVNELSQVMDLAVEGGVRVLVLQGAAGNFYAGGDIKEMQAMAKDRQTLASMNRAFGTMIEKASQLPYVVVAVLQGAVLGGGLGLACISDVAISDKSATFAMPETSLGIIPAQIAPFVVTRLGLTQARRLALLGLRISASEALSIGLVQQVSGSPEALEKDVDRLIKQVLRCAPDATAMTKALLHQVGNVPMDALLDQAAEDFVHTVAGEGREGALAFAEKRKPEWSVT